MFWWHVKKPKLHILCDHCDKAAAYAQNSNGQLRYFCADHARVGETETR